MTWSQATKYLGLYLDKTITFRQHITEIRTKFKNATHKYYSLICRKSKLNRRYKLLIYTLILKPFLTYASPVWGHSARTDINLLESSQSIILRQILDAHCRNEKKRVCKKKLTDATAGGTKLEPALTLTPVLMRGKCNHGEKDEKKDQYLKSLPRRGRLEEENCRTRTKLEYVTRARMEERRKEALSAPKTRSRSTKNAVGRKMLLFFFLCSRNEKEKSLQGETYRCHSRCNEAGASFNTDPSSDERQMHLNVVKCSN
ncbi:putative RNA-directed DNA polymerase from transposon X-element [Trichonephila clavipes]|nr:putative RNA-directed DNA polymerase from transposon X-element [Trichonephila clavipes]